MSKRTGLLVIAAASSMVLFASSALAEEGVHVVYLEDTKQTHAFGGDDEPEMDLLSFDAADDTATADFLFGPVTTNDAQALPSPGPVGMHRVYVEIMVDHFDPT